MAVDAVTLKIEKGVVENMEAFVLMVCFEQILNPVYSPFPHHNRAFCLESSRWKKSIWHNWFLSWNEKHFKREENCLGKSAFLYLNYMSTLFFMNFLSYIFHLFSLIFVEQGASTKRPKKNCWSLSQHPLQFLAPESTFVWHSTRNTTTGMVRF